jgi:hypothetical protein
MVAKKSLPMNSRIESEQSEPAALICSDTERVSICDLLDGLLNKGAAVAGEVTISVANVDLLYLDLRVLLTSIATLKREMKTESINSNR